MVGCANSIFTKYQDNQCVENCEDPNPARRVLFEQPVWQTLQMFMGEVRTSYPYITTVCFLVTDDPMSLRRLLDAM